MKPNYCYMCIYLTVLTKKLQNTRQKSSIFNTLQNDFPIIFKILSRSVATIIFDLILCAVVNQLYEAKISETFLFINSHKTVFFFIIIL